MLETKKKELTDKLEESKNRSMHKTLVFKNIRQPKQRKSWNQTKQILANKILNVMPELDKDFPTNKIERAHKAKRNNYETFLLIIAKFSYWTFSE